MTAQPQTRVHPSERITAKAEARRKDPTLSPTAQSTATAVKNVLGP